MRDWDSQNDAALISDLEEWSSLMEVRERQRLIHDETQRMQDIINPDERQAARRRIKESEEYTQRTLTKYGLATLEMRTNSLGVCLNITHLEQAYRQRETLNQSRCGCCGTFWAAGFQLCPRRDCRGAPLTVEGLANTWTAAMSSSVRYFLAEKCPGLDPECERARKMQTNEANVMFWYEYHVDMEKFRKGT